MEGWVDLGVGYIPRWFTCPQTVTHPSNNHLIATGPGVEPTTSRSQVQRPNRYTTKPPLFLTRSTQMHVWLHTNSSVCLTRVRVATALVAAAVVVVVNGYKRLTRIVVISRLTASVVAMATASEAQLDERPSVTTTTPAVHTHRIDTTSIHNTSARCRHIMRPSAYTAARNPKAKKCCFRKPDRP